MKTRILLAAFAALALGIVAVAETASDQKSPASTAQPAAPAVAKPATDALMITPFEPTGLALIQGDVAIALYKVKALSAASITTVELTKFGFRDATGDEYRAWTAKFGKDKINNQTERLLVKTVSLSAQDQTEIARRNHVTGAAPMPNAPAKDPNGS